MARALASVVGFVIFLYVLAHGVNFISGGRKVSEPRQIDSSQITPPGTELRFGEEAFVRHQDTRHDEDRDGIVAITVNSIEQGDQDQFQRRVDGSEGWVLYYIHATVENVSDENLGTAVFSLDLVKADGGATGFSMWGGSLRNPGFGSCRSRNFPTNADIGTIVETCELGGVRSGARPGGVRYGRYETPYFDDPIIWRE